MLRKFIGILLIATSIWLLWQLGQPEPTVKSSLAKKNQNLLAHILQILKTQPKPKEKSPFCQALNEQLDADISLQPFVTRVAQVAVLSQLKNPDTQSVVAQCLSEIFRIDPKLSDAYQLEFDVFDTTETPTRNSNTRAWKTTHSVEQTQVVFQISIFDRKSNKVAESGVTLPMAILQKSLLPVSPENTQKKTR